MNSNTTNQGLAVLTSIKSLQHAVMINRRANRTMIVAGPPGSAKTEASIDILHTMGRKVFPATMSDMLDSLPDGWAPKVQHVFASNESGEDWKGIPYRDNDVIRWSIPEYFRTLQRGDAIIVDECSNPFDQSMEGMLQNVAVGSRMRVGEWISPPDITRVMLCNRAEDGNVKYALSSVLGNRVAYYEFTGPDPINEWLPWYLSHGGNPLVAGVIRLEPSILNNYNPELISSPTCRAWFNAGSALDAMEFIAGGEHAVSDSERLRHVAALVGDTAALKLSAVFALRDKVIPFSKIVRDPSNAPIPEQSDPAVLFLTVTQVGARCTPNVWAPVSTYVARLPLEMQPIVMGQILHRHPELEQTGEFIEYTVRTAGLQAAA